MAAGEGTRLRPLTERWAKSVLPIDGRPVLAVLLRELARAGFLCDGHSISCSRAGARSLPPRARGSYCRPFSACATRWSSLTAAAA